MTVVEAINNSGIVVNNFFDLVIFAVDENGEQVGSILSEDQVSKEMFEVYIPKKYRDMEIVDYYKGRDCGRWFIAVNVRD